MGTSKMCRALADQDPQKFLKIFHNDREPIRSRTLKALARQLIRASKRDQLPDAYLVAEGEDHDYVIRLHRPGFVALLSEDGKLDTVAWLDRPPDDPAELELLRAEADACSDQWWPGPAICLPLSI